MFLQNTEILNDKDAFVFSPFCRLFVDNAFLQPYSRGFDLDGLLHDFRNCIRSSKNIDDVDLLGDVEQ